MFVIIDEDFKIHTLEYTSQVYTFNVNLNIITHTL